MLDDLQKRNLERWHLWMLYDKLPTTFSGWSTHGPMTYGGHLTNYDAEKVRRALFTEKKEKKEEEKKKEDDK